MDQKIDLVIDSIKKLLALGVSEDEIIKELSGVGINRDDAVQLIAKAKNPTVVVQQSVPQKESASSKEVFEKTASELSMDDQIVTQLGLSQQEKELMEAKGKSISSNVSSKKVVQETDEAEEEEKDMSEDKGDDEDKEVGEDKDKDEDENEIELSDVDFGLTIKGNTKNQSAVSPKKVVSSEPSPPKKEVSPQKPVQQTPPQKVSSPVSTNISSPNKDYFSSAPKSSSVDFSSKSFSSPSKENDSDVDELWKKGIVVAVNSRLSEMKKIKEDIDYVVQEKVDSSVRKELQQFKVLIDSQKELLLSSNKSALEEKQREITFIIDAKIAELKQYNKQLSENLAALDQAKSEQQVALQQIQQTLEDAKKVKSQLLVEMNSEMIKSKASAQSFLDQSDKHMKDLDERVNRTLELEKNIAEGMLQQAEQKIESLTLQKAEELIEELEVKLNKLRSVESEVNPEIIQQKIQVLDEFKKQFIITMRDNITQINASIVLLNQKNAQLDSQIREKMLVIDAKIEELSKFEKDFTTALQTSIGK